MAENDVVEAPEFEEGSEEQKEYIRRRAASVYNEDARKNQRRFGKLLTLAYSSTKAAGIMQVLLPVPSVVSEETTI